MWRRLEKQLDSVWWAGLMMAFSCVWLLIVVVTTWLLVTSPDGTKLAVMMWTLFSVLAADSVRGDVREFWLRRRSAARRRSYAEHLARRTVERD